MSKLEELIAEFCPDGVEYKTLADLTEFIKDGTHASLKSVDVGYPLLSAKDVYDGLVHIPDDCRKISEKDYQAIYKKYKLQTGDVLLTIVGSIGRTAIVDEASLEVAFQRSVGIIRTKRVLLPQFLVHLFGTKTVKIQLEKGTNQSAQGGVYLSSLGKITIPVPPIKVQSEIVRILDNFMELTAELTAKLIAELTARKKQYEYYREQFITSSTNCIVKLSEIVDIYLGLTATPTYTEEGVTFISAQNTSSDYLDLSNVKYISRKDFEKATSNAKPRRGDVLFTRVGSNLGHPVIVETDEELCIFVSLGYLRVKNNAVVLNSFLKHWMNTDLFWSQVRKNVHGAAKVNLNTGWLKDFDIILPTIEQQLKIIEILDKFEGLCNDITTGLSAEIEARKKQYEYYRDKLLTFKELS